MFKNLKIGVQISLGFAVVAVLLVVVSSVSYLGLTTAVTGFNDYRGLARDSNLASQVQANMLLVRLYAKDYLVNPGDRAVASFKERFAMLDKFTAEASRELQHPERAVKVKLVADEIVNYDKAFDKVVALMNERDRVVDQQLVPNGLAMRQAMTEVMESAYRDQDAETAFFAGRLQEAVLMGRLYVQKYLDDEPRRRRRGRAQGTRP
jgi:methyl-accepting chemotaxis protein